MGHQLPSSSCIRQRPRHGPYLRSGLGQLIAIHLENKLVSRKSKCTRPLHIYHHKHRLLVQTVGQNKCLVIHTRNTNLSHQCIFIFHTCHNFFKKDYLLLSIIFYAQTKVLKVVLGEVTNQESSRYP